jgi:precorrin-6A/cobalt-precorrin-6A reductase
MPEGRRVLILGGTAEAVDLATKISGSWNVTYSLAGRTRRPTLPENVVLRTGGFGGADALADWLLENDTDRVIDATHPFAHRIALNVQRACETAGIARLKLVRPAWKPVPGDDWLPVPDPNAAAALLPSVGQRGFLSIGRQDLAVFADAPDTVFLVRTVDRLETVPLANTTCVTGRGPFSEAQETELLRQHRIDVLVSKNAGGDSTYAKIEAARNLSIPVIMIGRPDPVAGETLETVDDAVDWLKEQR